MYALRNVRPHLLPTPFTMPALDWIGREAVLTHHRHVPVRLLEEDPEAGAGDQDAGNLIVEGDNLEALKALLPRYAGKVDCIYIDPPYNTGNEGWIYNDNVNSPQIQAWTSGTLSQREINHTDFTRHAKWLCMMYPRLMLLREMLAETGSLWVSLDDNESHHARTILDEIFGEANFVANVIWQKKYAPANDATHLSASHDHVLVYAKKKDLWRPNKIERDAGSLGAYKNPDADKRGPWKTGDYKCNKNSSERPNLYYAITNPTTGAEIWPDTTAVWRFSEERHARNVAEGRVWWGADGTNGTPAYKRFLADVDTGVTPQTVWTWREAGHTQDAAREQLAILPEAPFDTPKPTSLLQRIIHVATGPDALVLDAFAGSGTTAHAVLKQNALDGGRRRFVLVEMEPEVARPVTAERVRRAVEGYAFTGSHREELHRETITLTTLKKAEKMLAKADAVRAKHVDRFDSVKATVKDGALVVVGERKETKRVDGLGSGFRFATLGPAFLDASGGLNPAIPYADLARFAFYRATGQPMPDGDTEAPFLGAADGLGVYLLGTPGGDSAPAVLDGDVITRALLDALPPHDGERLVYAAASRVSQERLNAARVTFKQVPYQLFKEDE